jgi:alkylation response protein AidB-like acyl-CoA dehydrogenase
MAFTEAGTGSDPKQLTTTSTEQGDSIVLNGVKRFISNASYAGPMVIYAKDAETGLCSAYIIDKFCEGYSLSTPWEKVGIQASPIYDVFLDNILIPKTNLLGKAGEGYKVLLRESARGKLGHAAAALGIIASVNEKAIRYAKEKMHRGRPISKFQTIQLKIAQISAKYESAKWMLYHAASLVDDPAVNAAEFQARSALVKGYISDLAPECALLAMNVMGAYGTTNEYHVERLLRDALIQPHIEVVSDVQRLIYAGYAFSK